jgi:hypothetical protein
MDVRSSNRCATDIRPPKIRQTLSQFNLRQDIRQGNRLEAADYRRVIPGAGAKTSGNIEIGIGSKVAALSVVPPHARRHAHFPIKPRPSVAVPHRMPPLDRPAVPGV